MVDTAARSRVKPSEVPNEDKELQEELKTLVDKILSPDPKLLQPALEMLKFLIRTSTTSMTSVPKPLKYLAPYYFKIKEAHEKIKDPQAKKLCADIISVLTMGPIDSSQDAKASSTDCLKYCLLGTLTNIGDWGHEYVRQLEMEIVQRLFMNPKIEGTLEKLLTDIIKFDCKYNAEIQACDLLMEIDKLEMLPAFIDKNIYSRICLYLKLCAKYVEDIEAEKILELVVNQYIRFAEYSKAFIIAIELKDARTIEEIFKECNDSATLKQLSFIAARQLCSVKIGDDIPDKDEIINILNNNYLSANFQSFARELNILEPKSPEDVYKTWLEPVPMRFSILTENIDSAKQNLASSFVNGFVNVGFGSDKLLTVEGGNKWIYRNKDHGMLSATAALGLLYLWDVDGGLTPIDKYLYSKADEIKAGALLALGIVNCRVRNECDPALALLADFLKTPNIILQKGSIFGLGLAYIGTERTDVLTLLVSKVEVAKDEDIFGITSLSCGLVAVGTCNANVVQAILTKLLDWCETELLKSPHMLLAVLGLGMCFMGRKEAIDMILETIEIFPEPFKSISKTMLHLCSYAGTGDVLIIHELLSNCGERVEISESDSISESYFEPESDSKPAPEVSTKEKKKIKPELDPSIAQAVAVLGLGSVSMGDEVGAEMCQRLLGSVGRYSDPAIRRAVPLAIALISVSKPDLPVIDLLTKYSHDSDDKVACNAIFSLGIIGAGTNNARLAANLRQLAVFHAKNPSELFMVRISQGLTHLGKGTMTLSPWHTDRQLVDLCATAGLLIPLVALLDPHSLILDQSHYLLFALAAAIQPRWLLTLDENLQPISIPVRVGQAVDIIGKAGTPKTITGIHTHSTPVLLGAGERAELATNQYEQLSPILDGTCIIKKKSDDADSIM